MNAATQELPTVTLGQSSDLRHDKRRDNWTLVEDVPLGDGEIVLRLDSFLWEGEPYVNGKVMLERAKKMGSLAGQLHAERLLNQPDAVPKEWRDFVLVFPGTRWRYPSGRLSVPYLRWDGHEWGLSFRWLNDGFRSHSRLVRLGK